VRPRGKGEATVILRSGTEVPCSRQHRAGLMERLQP
jgi:two-component system LytT family response regulator